MTLTKQKARRSVTNSKKRTAQHHKKGPHYLKAYWPYLPVFAVLVVGIFANNSLTHLSHNVLGYATKVSSSQLLVDTNNARATQNEKPLIINAQLNDAAQTKANDMANRGYWSHVTPDGAQPWSFIQAAGYQYQAAGENLAYGFGTSDQIIGAWMGSAEHRANIMNADYREVGFGTANIADYQGHGPETIIVAMYATPLSGSTISQPTNQPIITGSNSQQVSRLQVVNGATWLQLVLAALCGAMLVVFFIRHTLAWHKVLVRGETFALHHPLFDLFIMGAAVLGFLLSHAAGTIL